MATVRQAYTSVYAKNTGSYSRAVRQKLTEYEREYEKKTGAAAEKLRQAYGSYERKRRAVPQAARAAGISGGSVSDRRIAQRTALADAVRAAAETDRAAYQTLKDKTDRAVVTEEARIARERAAAAAALRKAAEKEQAAAEKTAAKTAKKKTSSAGKKKTAGTGKAVKAAVRGVKKAVSVEKSAAAGRHKQTVKTVLQSALTGAATAGIDIRRKKK